MKSFPFLFLASTLLPAMIASAQEAASPSTPVAASAATVVPALVPFSGTALSANERPLAGQNQITFLLFKDERGGEPIGSKPNGSR